MKTEEEIRFFLREHPNANSLCRICLTVHAEDLASLFELNGTVSYADKVMLCTKVRINCNDRLPGGICTKCLWQLCIANSFRIQCEVSDSILRKVISSPNDETPTKESLLNTVKLEDISSFIKIEESNSKHLNNFEETICNSDRETIEKCTLPRRLCNTETEFKNVIFENKSECIPYSKPSTGCRDNKTEQSVIGSSFGGKLNGIKERKSKVLSCEECAYTTRRSQAMTYHRRTHTGEKPYKCTECSKCFTQSSSLNHHVRSHSDQIHFICPVCGKQFKTRSKFQVHKLVHSTEKRFICTICDKGCKTKTTLNQHTKRHYNIKDYSCDVCGMTFVTHSELLNHSVHHREIKKYECNICQYKARKKSCLKDHLMRHAGVLPFSCELCKAAFFTRSKLLDHIRSHTKERKYSCPECEAKFIHSQSINRHVLTKHGKVYKYSDTVDRRIIK